MKDQILVQMYVGHNIPCDRLVSNPEMLTRFTDEYVAFTGDRVSPSAVGHRLLNLRRRGEDKGGLPRLRRSYNGRGRWRT